MHALILRLILLGFGLATSLASPSRAADVTIQLGAGDNFVIQDNTGAIERLKVEEATGNVSRNGALFVHTTGSDSSFVGVGAGNASTTGNENTGFGNGVLSVVTSGSYNSAFGAQGLSSNTTGILNSAFGRNALAYNTDGQRNSAFGGNALKSNTVGGGNSAFGESALFYNSSGSTNSAFGYGALSYNDDGYGNSGFGALALYYNTSGYQNSAFGENSLHYNTTGGRNSAFGSGALYYNYDGVRNAAFGEQAMTNNYSGSDNVAVGSRSLRDNVSGYQNVGLGARALQSNTTGYRNVAIGHLAGRNQTTGSDNIYLKNDGIAGESGQIKIGAVGVHTQATMAGIHGNTSTGGIAVLVNANGVMGTMTSSARFKQDVQDMGDDSAPLLALRPVTFRYRDAVAAGEDVAEYGLIAEEVAEIFPALAAPDATGKPFSVRYHILAPLLLNELQKEATLNKAQAAEIGALLSRVARLESQLASGRREVAAGE